MKNDFEMAKASLREKGSTEGTLMANLVHAFVESEESSNFSISEQEVFGNMFAYNFSGHDTTARSLNFTFYLLAAYPEVQDWVREEIRHVLGGGSTSTPSYESVPRLIRCTAVMVSGATWLWTAASGSINFMESLTKLIPYTVARGPASLPRPRNSPQTHPKEDRPRNRWQDVFYPAADSAPL